MHLTTIILKDDKEFSGFIEKVKLAEELESCSIKLFDHPPIFVRDIKSAVTEKDRISVNKIGDVDELERIKSVWCLEKRRKR